MKRVPVIASPSYWVRIVAMTVREHISRTRRTNFTRLSVHVIYGVARSSGSGGVPICYILSVNHFVGDVM